MDPTELRCAGLKLCNEMTIKIVSINNLRGSKDDKFSVFLRVQFGELFSFDTEPSENLNFNVNHTHEQKISVTEEIINAILNESIRFTLVEVLPKEKFLDIGSASVEIGPHFLPYKQIDPLSEHYPKALQTKFEKTFAVSFEGIAAQKSKDAIKESQETTVQIEISFARPLLSPELMFQGRFVTFSPIIMHPCPEDWSVKEGTDIASNVFNYCATIVLPGSKKEYSVKCGVLSMTNVSSTKIESEALYANSESSQDDSEELVKTVTWAQSYTAFLPFDQVVELRKSISEKAQAEITFRRVVASRFANLNESHPPKLTAIATVDCKILTFMKVLGIKGSVLLSSKDSTASEPSDKKKNTDAPVPISNYTTVGSSLSFSIHLSRPLLEKKVLAPIVKRVSDFIQNRLIPEDELRKLQVAKVRENYMVEIQDAVALLVIEYTKAQKESNGDSEALKKTFTQNVNSQGLYYQIKEKLKKKVTNIVREVYQQKSNFVSKAELHLFMTDLYVYLLDSMNEAVEQLTVTHKKKCTQVEIDQLLYFADLSEQENDIPAAKRYLLERIARNEDSLTSWYQYASFCMRSRLYLTGEESFREILSRNAGHVNSLLAYGAICHMNNKIEEARVYFNTAIKIQPRGYLGLSLMGLLYSSIENDEEGDKFLKRAEEVYIEAHADLEKDSNVLLTLLQDAAQFLTSVFAYPLAQEAISKGLLLATDTCTLMILCAKLELQKGDFDRSVALTKDLLNENFSNYRAWAFIGSLYIARNENVKACEALESALSLASESDIGLWAINYNLGQCYLREKHSHNYVRTKQLLLKACELRPSSRTWLGVSKVCSLLGEDQEAEEALLEANAMNNRDVHVWSQIAHSYLKKSKPFEATKAVYQALRHGLDDPTILSDLGNALCESREFVVAASCYKIALDNAGDNLIDNESEEKLNLIYELETALDATMKMVSILNAAHSSIANIDKSASDIYAARPIGFSV